MRVFAEIAGVVLPFSRKFTYLTWKMRPSGDNYTKFSSERRTYLCPSEDKMAPPSFAGALFQAHQCRLS